MDNYKNPLSKKLLETCPCPFPDCTSSDGFQIFEKTYESGGKVIDGYCFVCRRHSKDPYKDLHESGEGSINYQKKVEHNNPAHTGQKWKAPDVDEGLSHPIRNIKDRGISYSTAEYYGVRIGVSSTDGETPVYTLFPRYREDNLVGWKMKIPNNTPPYLSSGGNDIEPFGAHLLKSVGKKIYVTEGEFDALSVFQALKEGSNIEGYNPPVISISDGAGSATKSLNKISDKLDGFEEIVLVFDNDEQGKKAKKDVCKAFAGKVSYVNIPYPYKDANDMIMAGKSNDLKWLCLSHSKKYHPDGIITPTKLWEKYKNQNKNRNYYPYPDTMPILNEKMYGAWPGSIITITSGTSSGKTQFVKELLYHFYKTTPEKIAGMFLEEDAPHTLSSLMSLHLNKRIYLPDVTATEEEENEAFKYLFSDNRISLYDYFGGMDDSSLLSKLRYFAVTGHKFIFLDHLSIVVSEYAAEGGERERIDTLMTKLAKFVKEYGIVLFLIVHLRKTDNSRTAFELGSTPTLDDLRGSGSLKQLTWDAIGLSRNQQHESKYCSNVTELTVLKCRLTGRTGTADYLHFNNETGRMVNVEKPANYRSKSIRSNNNEF